MLISRDIRGNGGFASLQLWGSEGEKLGAMLSAPAAGGIGVPFGQSTCYCGVCVVFVLTRFFRSLAEAPRAL